MSAGAWIVADWLIIGLTASAAAGWLQWSGHAYAWSAKPWLVGWVFCVATSAAGLVFGLYERRTLLVRSRILVRTLLTVALGIVLAFACLLLFFYAAASRWIGVFVAAAYLLAGIPLRLLAHELITTSPVRLLCIGDGDSIQKLTAILAQIHRRTYEVIGHVRVPQGTFRVVAGALAHGPGPRFRSQADLAFQDGCPCVGSLDRVGDLITECDVDEIVVGTELASDPAVARAVGTCLDRRCRMTDQATFVEKLLGEVPVEHISSEWFLRADVQNRGNYEAVSRLRDLIVATCGLLLVLPLWPLIALLIWLERRGPILYRQVRVGRHGRCFTMYKFRTMRVDAEKDGVRWAQPNDGRVTRVGRWLRRSRLDELPQLLNILRGDMALVGPRPERPEFVHQLAPLLPHYRLRHLIKPGLTGWAQIHYGYGASVADAHRKLCFDLYYLKHRALEFDVAILMRTVGTFILGSR